MRVSDTVLHSHMKEYVSAVMATTLRSHGFTSKSENQSHWYRIKGGELVQAIFFSTSDGYLPAFADISYCCHPFFVKPEFPKGTRRRGLQRSIHSVTPYKVLGKKDVTTAPYSSNAMIMCPLDAYYGLDLAVEVIELLNSISTIEQSYQKRISDFEVVSKRTNIPVEDLWIRLLSPEMMNEVVFLEDTKMYSYCAKSIKNKLDYFNKWEGKRRLSEIEMYEFSELKRLEFAIIEGHRNEHINYLAECSKTYALQLKKKVKGIQCVL